jgi:hypothetical protein
MTASRYRPALFAYCSRETTSASRRVRQRPLLGGSPFLDDDFDPLRLHR